MFGILKKLLPQQKPVRRTRGKGRKIQSKKAAPLETVNAGELKREVLQRNQDGISTTKPHQSRPVAGSEPEVTLEPVTPVQEGPIGEPVGAAQAHDGPGEEDTSEDQGRGRASGEAPVARKRRGKKSKTSRPD